MIDQTMDQQQQNNKNQFDHSNPQIRPLFTRSTCSHTILNSPSSRCKLHIVSLNQRQQLNNYRSNEIESSSDNQRPPSNERSMSMISTLSTLPQHQQQTKFQSSSTNTITEISSSLLSSPKSPCQINFGCNAITSQIDQITTSKNFYSLQSPTNCSKISSTTSRTSSLRSRSLQGFFLNNNDNNNLNNQNVNFLKKFYTNFICICCSIDWLKFGFKLLLLFTVLFWLFSIITWMSIMPRTMPISLTIITSMMTIGLIISLVIQSEWPYSFEFMPNNNYIANSDDDDEDDDDVVVDNDMKIKSSKHSNNSNDQKIKTNNGYKNVKNYVDDDDNVDDNSLIINMAQKHKMFAQKREESNDSGIVDHNSISTVHQQQQQHHKHQQQEYLKLKPQEISVIQMMNDNITCNNIDKNDHY